MAARKWGHYIVLWKNCNVKIKYIRVNPHYGLSFQKHNHRGELWFIVSGTATINTYGLPGIPAEEVERDKLQDHKRTKHQFFYINKGEWHQLINEEDDLLIVIEIQFGDKCDEEDIERLFYYDYLLPNL